MANNKCGTVFLSGIWEYNGSVVELVSIDDAL
jgi:hypothetical protein